MPLQKSTILVVSHDPQLADIRKSVLESAGFHVIQVNDDASVRKFCLQQRPKLVMIGYSVPPAQKRRVWDEARRICKVPILELHRGTTPELMPPAYFHESETPDDFIHSVMKIIKHQLN